MVFEQVLGMPHAYIPFTPERQGHLDVINAYLHARGIYPIGRFGEWKYVNQDGAILSAKRVVESVQSGDRVRPAGRPGPRPVDGAGPTGRLLGARIALGDPRRGPAAARCRAAPHGGHRQEVTSRMDPPPRSRGRRRRRAAPEIDEPRPVATCPGCGSRPDAAISRPRTASRS